METAFLHSPRAVHIMSRRGEFRFDGPRNRNTPDNNHLSRSESPRLTVDGLFHFRASDNQGSARPAASMKSAVRVPAPRPARQTVVLFPVRGKRHGGPAGQARRLEPCAIGRTWFRTAERLRKDRDDAL